MSNLEVTLCSLTYSEAIEDTICRLCSQPLFHALGVQDIPPSSWLSICNTLYDVTYKIASLHIFKEMFEIIKVCSFLAIIYYWR